MAHTTVLVPSVTGNKLEAWLYVPSTPGPHAIIVMGHGFGLVKSGGLAPFCEAFVAAGYAAITFDYLSFGGSEGTPRNVVSVDQELQDFRDVIAWVRKNPAFNNDKIVAWGTSFGGMHTTALIAEDHKLAAAISQCPVVDGFVASMNLPMLRSLRMTIRAIFDVIGSWFGMGPLYLTTAEDGKADLALLMGPDVSEGWQRLMPRDGSTFINHIAARSLFSILIHRPALRVHRSIKPYLIVVSEYDSLAPVETTEKAAKAAPLGELVKVKGGHFDLYKGGLGFDDNVKAQLEFLNRVVPVSKPSL